MKNVLPGVQVLLARAGAVTGTGCSCHGQGCAGTPFELESCGQSGSLERGTVPWTLHPPLRKIPLQSCLGGFCPAQDSCHVAAHPQLPFPVSEQFSLWRCRRLSLAAFPKKQRRMVLVSLSS